MEGQKKFLDYKEKGKNTKPNKGARNAKYKIPTPGRTIIEGLNAESLSNMFEVIGSVSNVLFFRGDH